MREPAVDDRYTIPDSEGVLRNQFGLETHEQLDEAMNDYASLEWAALSMEPMPEEFDFAFSPRSITGCSAGSSATTSWGTGPVGSVRTPRRWAR